MKVHHEKIDLSIFVLGFILVGLIFAVTLKVLSPSADEASGYTSIFDSDGSFITIYDSDIGEPVTLLTSASTVGEALERVGVEIDSADIVEPAQSEEITSKAFRINIYRARPVMVVDGVKQYKFMTASSDPGDVVVAAGVEMLTADVVKITTTANFIESGLPIAYTVVRANTINFNYYGEMLQVRTGAETIGGFFEEQKISISEEDWVSLPFDDEITDGLSVELFRQGKNTITAEEEIAFSEQITYDHSYNIGFRDVTQLGVKGKKAATYEVEMQDGKEVSRKLISEMTLEEPITQFVTIGMRAINMKPLTKQMGRNRYTTSNNILREETYYDLNMSVVMTNCGGGGHYSVRYDGVKVDKDGYVIIAANLNLYPRCSVVETSLGIGKVYDTGAFALTNLEQFDIATDWTRPDGI